MKTDRNKKKIEKIILMFEWAVIFLFPMAFLMLLGVKNQSNYSIIKAIAISAYYMIYSVQKWYGMGHILLTMAVITTVWKATSEKVGNKKFFSKSGLTVVSSTLSVWFCYLLVVLKVGDLDGHALAGGLLRFVFILWILIVSANGTGWLCTHILSEKASEKKDFSGWIFSLLIVVLFITWLMLAWSGKYVYPQGDDFEYGANSHLAWVHGKGALGAFGGACKTVADAFGSWQGTFSSIFLMALQPGIWGEQYYHLTPALLSGLLSIAVLIFSYQFFHILFGAGKKEAGILGCLLAILALQFAPAKVSAFYWWNGGIHYTGAFSFLLLFTAFLIHAIVGKEKRVLYSVLAAWMAVMVGGGNLVTALIGNVVTGYVILILLWIERKDLLKYLALPGGAMLVAFCINVVAPGNWIRQGKSGEIVSYGVIGSILKSFVLCIQDIAGDWTGIFWVFLILMVLPVLWTIASKTEFEFPLPGVITLAGYCFLSAMYAPQLFALGQWGTGRIENIMYDMFLILTVVLEFYWIGWIQKKQKLYWNADSHLKWYGFCTGMTVLCFLLVSLASPKEITSAAIVNAVRSGEARAYADAIEQNIETIKNSDEDLILIQEPPKTPELFTTDEIETWRFGTAEYYGKNKIRYYEELDK